MVARHEDPEVWLAMVRDEWCPRSGATFSETHDLIDAPHYRYPVHQHTYRVTAPLSAVTIEFQMCGKRLPSSMKTPKGKDFYRWCMLCKEELST